MAVAARAPAWLCLAIAVAVAAWPAGAQPSAPSASPPAGSAFVRAAHGLSTLQLRAAELASSRDTRPEAKAYAERMLEFRRDQLPKLEQAARDNKAAIPTAKEFEHQILIENLEPLDYLALSRRYAEMQVQALEQEVKLYAAAQQSPEAWVKAVAGETGPRLKEFLDEARAMQKAIGP